MIVPIKYNLRNLFQRKLRTILTILGIAGSIAIFIAVMAFSEGMVKSFKKTGSEDNIVVIQKGAFSQSLSSIPKSSRNVIQYLPHIKKLNGIELVSPEVSIEPWVSVPSKGLNDIFMMVRGVKPIFFDVVNKIRISDSKELRNNHAIIGRLAQHKLGSVQVGDQIKIFDEMWTINGVFEAEGSSFESLIIVDIDDLLRASNREEYSSYTVKVDSLNNIDSLIKLIEDDRRFLLSAIPEIEYYTESGMLFNIVRTVGIAIGIIISIGSIFGGMNTMYTSIANRIREIGTLRAIGFSRVSILISFIIESLIIALIGGMLGILVGYFVNGTKMNLLMSNFELRVTYKVMLTGLFLSFVIGFFGGLLPARQASKLKIIDAIKHV